MPRCPNCDTYNVTDYNNASEWGKEIAAKAAIMGGGGLVFGPKGGIIGGGLGVLTGLADRITGTRYKCNECGYKF